MFKWDAFVDIFVFGCHTVMKFLSCVWTSRIQDVCVSSEISSRQWCYWAEQLGLRHLLQQSFHLLSCSSAFQSRFSKFDQSTYSCLQTLETVSWMIEISHLEQEATSIFLVLYCGFLFLILLLFGSENKEECSGLMCIFYHIIMLLC